MRAKKAGGYLWGTFHTHPAGYPAKSPLFCWAGRAVLMAGRPGNSAAKLGPVPACACDLSEGYEASAWYTVAAANFETCPGTRAAYHAALAPGEDWSGLEPWPVTAPGRARVRKAATCA